MRSVADALAIDARQLARGVIAETELPRYQAFVECYAREQPLTDLGFVRTSVLHGWTAETGQQASLVGSLGTVSQSMSDISERMRMFSASAPSQVLWEAQLAIRGSDLGRADFGRAFAQAGESLDRLTLLAESSPEQLRIAIADLRASMLTVSDRFDASWARMIRCVEEQREALAGNVQRRASRR